MDPGLELADDGRLGKNTASLGRSKLESWMWRARKVSMIGIVGCSWRQSTVQRECFQLGRCRDQHFYSKHLCSQHLCSKHHYCEHSESPTSNRAKPYIPCCKEVKNIMNVLIYHNVSSTKPPLQLPLP